VTRAIQISESARTWDEAYSMLRGLSNQEGYLGGRVMPPSAGKPWRVQVLVEDNPHAGDMWLPDGCRRVLVPEGLWKQLVAPVRVKTCRTCQDNGPDVVHRPMQRGPLCASCYVDAMAGSSTRAVAVEACARQDRYTLLAVKHGV
jgi:hypothetical protein